MREDLDHAVKNVVEARIDRPNSIAAHLEESVFLVHKAANVLCAAHDQAAGGLPTWSLATAYQAALFAATACCGFLGVFLHSYVQKSFIVDFFPQPPAGMSRKALETYKIGIETHVIKFESSVSHFHSWALFKRLIRMTVDIDFDDQVIKLLDKVHDKSYAEQRNDLHYNHAWQYGDLHSYMDVPALTVPHTRAAFESMFDPASSEFGMAIGTTLVSLATKLLADLAATSPLLAAEYQRLQTACSMPRMKLRHEYERASGIALI